MEDTMNFFEKAKATIKNTTIPVPISTEMFKKMLEHVNLKDIKQIDVFYDEETIILKGKCKKMLLWIPFHIVLRPFKSFGRVIYFTVEKLSPLNTEWLKKKIFHFPPYMKYEEPNIEIDFNGFEAVKRVPVGTIRSFEIKNQRLVVNIGI